MPPLSSQTRAHIYQQIWSQTKRTILTTSFFAGLWVFMMTSRPTRPLYSFEQSTLHLYVGVLTGVAVAGTLFCAWLWKLLARRALLWELTTGLGVAAPAAERVYRDHFDFPWTAGSRLYVTDESRFFVGLAVAVERARET